ncbi:MAG: hypothetical protein K9N49_04840 [Candidatus Marinimicrobia bacterium]|nr:hypothetical protein [Candidatus Neomarinimicrobiota bacterium]
MKQVTCLLMFCMLGSGVRAGPVGDWPAETHWRAASASSEMAGYSFSKVQRWLREVALKRVDPETGLYRGNWIWSYADAAADCYPFVVWAAYVTDLDALNGPVLDMLHAEIRQCNQYGQIPVTWNFKAGRGPVGKQVDDSLEQVFFGASEYAKDGLTAIIELLDPRGLGRPWFERLLAIETEMWARADRPSPHGLLPPHDSAQFPGDQLQVLTRLFSMTRDPQFLEYADRLALNVLEDETFTLSKLSDHGCEVIGGLGLWLGVTAELDPVRARSYLPKLRGVLDSIIERGLNPDGLMLQALQDTPGRHEGDLSDGWGYNYVAFLCYDAVAGEKRYEPYVREALTSLGQPAYRDRRWGSVVDPKRNVALVTLDQYADSIEGALYLLARVREPAGFEWADGEMARNVIFSQKPLTETDLWGTSKFESNAVRTVIMHAMLHSGGVLARPWRQGMGLGAAIVGEQLALVISVAEDWEGQLAFDRPRHRLHMGFDHDWPRMNTVPEWWAVEPATRYRIRYADGREEFRSGAELSAGLAVRVTPESPLRLVVEPAPAQR